MDMEAGLDAQGNVVAWTGDFYIALNHIVAFKPLDFPLLAAAEQGLPRPGNWVGFLFQNSGQPYQIPNVRVNTRHIAEAFFRSSHLRSPGRIENSFANEAFMDELAQAANADPAEFRLRYLKDQRAIDVVQAAMKLAGWQARPGPEPECGQRRGRERRGISYLRYNNAITYVAAVAEVEVEQGDRRDPRDAGLRQPRLRRDGQSGWRRQPGRGRRAANGEPHADGAGELGPQQGHQRRLGELPDHAPHAGAEGRGRR